MQHQLNISKISAISNEFAKGKVTLRGWEKTSVVEPAMYVHKHVVTLRLHESLLLHATSRGIETVQGARCSFFTGSFTGTFCQHWTF